MQVTKFRPLRWPVLSGFDLRLLEHGVRRLSLSLGKYPPLEVKLIGDSIVFEWRGHEVSVPLDAIRSVLKSDRAVCAINPRTCDVVPARKFDDEMGHYYQLVAIAPDTEPTLEIDGIHMHAVKDTTPLRDAVAKVRALGVRRGDVVLDVCTGLGYTAICELKAGAKHVVSIEKDKNVLELASLNPWSEELEQVEVILGDACEVVRELEDGTFDRVLHDPPRITPETGNLYSRDFYRELFRVLKPGGSLFHYVGNPGQRRGKRILSGVAERLRDVGFIIKRVYRDRGWIIARKPW